jgi:TPR repeat protein
LLFTSLCAWSGQLEDAIDARNRGDFATAFNAFTQLASNGNAQGQFQLSLLYASRKGVAADAKQAFSWLRQAATHGDFQPCL